MTKFYVVYDTETIEDAIDEQNYWSYKTEKEMKDSYDDRDTSDEDEKFAILEVVQTGAITAEKTIKVTFDTPVVKKKGK